MKVYLAVPRGFCSGVHRAMEIVNTALAETSGNEAKKPVYILHELVHNEIVVNDLISRGAHIIDEPEEAPANATIIFSAHGVSADIEERASAAGLHCIDATCPLVKAVQKKASSLSEKGYVIILFGKRGHRETEGILGRIPGKSFLLENIEETRAFIPDANEKYACLSQTTLNASSLEQMTDILRKKISNLHVEAAVCNATAERQNSVRKLAKICDRVIILGSENSSNTKRLREVAISEGTDAVLIPSFHELPAGFITGAQNIGIATGASAPDQLVNELLAHLESIGCEYAGEIHA